MKWTPLSKQYVNDDPHPFGGCVKLLDHYKQIGATLLRYEVGFIKRCFQIVGMSEEAQRDFSLAVSFIPVEVLESYLDDLLDLQISDESLFINKPKGSCKFYGLIGIFFTVATTILLSYQDGLPLWLGWVGTVAVLLITLLFFSIPRFKIFRRFDFATLLSHEICKRNGSGKTPLDSVSSRALFSNILSSGELLAMGRTYKGQVIH